jgi:hypothetical protein
MPEFELVVPEGVDSVAAARLIEGLCQEAGLQMTLKGTLVKYPGCVHWHYKRGKEPGTLEITLWLVKRLLWFPMRARRAVPWVEAVAAGLAESMAKQMAEMSE